MSPPPNDVRIGPSVPPLERTLERTVEGRGHVGRVLEGGAARGEFLFLALEGARPLAGGARWALDGVDEVRFRRGPLRAGVRTDDGARNVLVVTLPDEQVSSMHATLARTNDGFELRDHDSTNGTYVDGARVRSSPLRDSSRFELGSTHFVLRLGLDSPGVARFELESSEVPEAHKGVASLLPGYAAELDKLAKIAATDLSVLLLGESGSGKEVLATALHRLSNRTGPFVGVNCGALPESLIESQLFGHVKGAFSGATSNEPGFIRAAHGGTLFLDEIGDLPEASQAALLRVLETREVVPVGSTRPVPVEVRVVSATLKAKSSLRPDLYSRLAGYTHALPPLAERIEDLGLIVAVLLARTAGERASTLRIAPEAGRALVAYPWPLNVRELSQALGVALALAPGTKIELDHLPGSVRSSENEEALPSAAAGATNPKPRSVTPSAASAPSPARSTPALPKDDASLRALLVATLEAHRGNVSEVSRVLGKTRMQIHRWMRRFSIDPQSYRS